VPFDGSTDVVLQAYSDVLGAQVQANSTLGDGHSTSLVVFEPGVSTAGPTGATGATGATGPSGGSAAVVQLADQTVTGSPASSVSFASISGSYSHLYLVIQARGDTASVGVPVRLRFNGDSTSGHYAWQNPEFYAGNTANGSESTSDTAIKLGQMSGASSPSGDAGSLRVDIPNYTGTTFHKNAISTYGQRSNTGGSAVVTGISYGIWLASPAAVTSIDILPGSGNFVVGSRFTLYGES
jgi:hypothetical protein